MEEERQQLDSQDSQPALHSDLHPLHNSLNCLDSLVPTRLLYPVIIPQRRPSDRSRGFTRAYAPDLARCGIDQATFLAFLDGFDKAIAASPWVGGVNLAGAAAGAVPSAIAAGVGLAVQVTAGIYKEVQSRKVQNEYLVKMNDGLFRPRGLYCLVMTCAPAKNSDRSVGLDSRSVDDAVMQRYEDSTSNRFRSNDGVTEGIDVAASAELIYPDSEDAAEQEDGKSWKSRLSKMVDKNNERKDDKAQRKYLKKNPSSDLGALMSPNIILSPKDLEKQKKKREKEERKQGKEERKREQWERKHSEREPKKRKLKKGILYLMIVNMPSDDEMGIARRLIERGVVP